MTQKMMKNEHDYFNEWIVRKRNRITRKNKNWLCVACGETGTSKSFSSARICELIDPSFMPCIIENGITSRVAMGFASNFIIMITKGKELGTLKRGSMCMFDEAGVGLSSRDWYTESNKVVNYVLQTFRHFNIGVIFTVPDLSFIDVQARKLFHTYLECLKIDYEKNLAIIKPMDMQNNPRIGEIYFKYPMFHGVKITRFWVSKPPKEFIKRYEPLKVELSDQLAKDAIESNEYERRKREFKKLADVDIMRAIKKEQIPLDAYTLRFRFGIGKDRAYSIIANYEKFSPSI